MTPFDFPTRAYSDAIADQHMEVLREAGAIVAAKDEPLLPPQPTDHALVAFTLAVTFAIGWGLIAGPALLGYVLGISAVGLLVWEVVRHWAELREWWG